MRKQLILGLPLALLVWVDAAPAGADDIRGSQLVLCTAVQATICSEDADCEIKNPWDLNIPQFLELDLKEKKISTTKASGENRATPIRTLEREDGLLFIQGIEGGRAFSFVISETSGMLSAAVARDGKAVSVFGACTPLMAGK